MEIGTTDGTGRIRKTPRVTGRASGVTCTRLLGGGLNADGIYCTPSSIIARCGASDARRLYFFPFTSVFSRCGASDARRLYFFSVRFRYFSLRCDRYA